MLSLCVCASLVRCVMMSMCSVVIHVCGVMMRVRCTSVSLRACMLSVACARANILDAHTFTEEIL